MVGGNRIERGSQRTRCRAVSGVGEAAPEAVAAVHGTGTGRDQQGAAGIFLQQSRRQHAVEVANRVGAEVRQDGVFGIHRQHLPEQRGSEGSP
jgi:hypothetical protein